MKIDDFCLIFQFKSIFSKNNQNIGQKFWQVNFWDALKILKIEKKIQKSTKKNNVDYLLKDHPIPPSKYYFELF